MHYYNKIIISIEQTEIMGIFLSEIKKIYKKMSMTQHLKF